MTTVEELIGELLLRHNCVIVPAFGGFVAKQSSAQIDYRNGLMLPPRKSLLFNRNLIQNDGLLIAEFAQRNICSYGDAEAVIKTKIDSWFDALRLGERINIDRVGFLFIDSEKNIGFEQDRFFNLLMGSFGMGKVHFVSEEEAEGIQQLAKIKPIRSTEEVQVHSGVKEEAKKQKTLVKETLNDEPKVVQLPVVANRPKIWRYIAAACLLPITFYSFWIPLKTDVLESKMISVKDFNPFLERASALYEKQDLGTVSFEKDEDETLEQQLNKLSVEKDVYIYNFSDDFYIPVKLNKPAPGTTELIKELQPEEKKQATNANMGGTHFIVGCFGSKDNANSLVSKLNSEGFSATIVDIKGGLHRVSCGKAVSEQELANLRQKAESLGYQGWVLKK